MNDLRFALRQLTKHPGFTLVAVLTLALGIGANTTVFSAVYAAVLSRPPYPASDELRVVMRTMTPPNGVADTSLYWSYPTYAAFRAAAGDVAVAAYTPSALSYNLAGPDQPRQVHAELVSASYFGVLGVPAALGRTLAPDEDATPDTHPVALISDALWRTAFGGDSTLVGRTISLNAIQLTVVGVMPPGFTGLSGEADVWAPMMMAPTLVFSRRLRQQFSFWHSVIARVPASDEARAATEIAAAGPVVGEQIPFAEAFGPVEVGFVSLPLAKTLVDQPLSRALWILLAAVGCVLLIACVNVANLLLARGAHRSRELGVRVALGVSRGRLLRQLVTESVLLGALGGGVALILAWWGLAMVQALRPAALSAPGTLAQLHLSAPVLLFNFVVAMLAALAFGVVPALAAIRSDPRRMLSGFGRTTSRAGPRGMLVAAEVAVAVVLLTGAALLLRSFDRLHSVPLGFAPDHVLTAYVNVPRTAYSGDGAVTLFTEATRRLDRAPGVERAAVANCLPAKSGCDHVRMQIRDEVAAADQPGHQVWMNMVSSAYFATLGIPVIQGRALDEGDRVDAPRVAVVTQTAANQYWPGRDPVGAHIQLSVGWGPEDDWAEVVGVVGDVTGASLHEAPQPGVYLSYPQYSYLSNYLVVQAAGDPRGLVGTVRTALQGLDPTLPLWDVHTMNERVATVTARDRFTTVLLGLFGTIALMLAAVGIYGVMAFSVAARTREMGLRMAIGARAGDVLGLVLREGMRFSLIGLVVGLALAVVLSGLLRSQLYEISPLDSIAFVGAAAVLIAVAVLACYLPARRATKIDPMEALRYE